MSGAEKPPDELVVPPSIKAVIDEFETRGDAYEVHDVHSALCQARKALENPRAAESYGAWAEILAFGLAGPDHNEKPWGTYFGPMGSATNAEGETVYFPDITDADAKVIDLWIDRAHTLRSPILVSRYTDLVWDLCQRIAQRKPRVEFARAAIDAYLTISSQQERDLHDRFPVVERALSIAIQISDTSRRDTARAALFSLHEEAIAAGGRWWKIFNVLERQPKSGVTDEEYATVIADLEDVLARVADTSSPENFDPHASESAAKKLIKHYRRKQMQDEVNRLYTTIGRVYEHFGTMGDALLASMVLQTSMDAYSQAGLIDDANRILRLIEKANVEAVSLMNKVEHTHEIPADEVKRFLDSIVGDTVEETFTRIALQFMTQQEAAEKGLAETKKVAPLSAVFSKTLMEGDRVIAHIGSLDDDPMGHLINHVATDLGFRAPWLHWALDHARGTHDVDASDIVAWTNRTGLFGDGRLLHEGIAAWLSGDHVKAFHVLVPQIERAFREILRFCGCTVTKAHPQMPQARVVATMGELLFNQEAAEALGPHGRDLVLHFRALFTDPRGMNLRNNIAHGLISIDRLDTGLADWLIHALLLLGRWLQPVPKAAGPEAPTSDYSPSGSSEASG